MVAEASYAHCLRLAQAHYENFPVASRLLPRSARPHIAAIYACARVADDFADEGDRTVENRLSLLDDWARRLDAAAAGRVEADGSDAAHIFTALARTMRTCRLERSLFDDLLGAFRQDVTTTRYETWNDVLDYCRRSADPIGRLVLRVSGYRDARLDRFADAVCTALQLTNFWQDIERDWAKGRVYMPRDLLRASGADEADLGKRRITDPWRAALAEASRRTRALFTTGRPIADAVSGRLRWELRATWLGGVRILDRLEAAQFDVFAHRPTLSRGDVPAMAWRMLTWRQLPQS